MKYKHLKPGMLYYSNEYVRLDSCDNCNIIGWSDDLYDVLCRKCGQCTIRTTGKVGKWVSTTKWWTFWKSSGYWSIVNEE